MALVLDELDVLNQPNSTNRVLHIQFQLFDDSIFFYRTPWLKVVVSLRYCPENEEITRKFCIEKIYGSITLDEFNRNHEELLGDSGLNIKELSPTQKKCSTEVFCELRCGTLSFVVPFGFYGEMIQTKPPHYDEAVRRARLVLTGKGFRVK